MIIFVFGSDGMLEMLAMASKRIYSMLNILLIIFNIFDLCFIRFSQFKNPMSSHKIPHNVVM